MLTRQRPLLFIHALMLFLGCGGPPEPEPALSQMRQEVLIENGQQHNTPLLTGLFDELAWFDATSGELSGSALSNVRVRRSSTGGELSADTAAASNLRGADLKNATFAATTAQGRVVRLRLDDVATVEGGGTDYLVSVQLAGTTWTPLCPDGPTLVLPGYFMAGGQYISHSQRMMLACRHSAVYKCARRLKYYPDTNETDSQYHQACVRMIRGDYCGNGTPHTANGTVIDAFDRAGRNPSEQLSSGSMTLEAFWTTGGAYCIWSPRHPLDATRPEDQCALAIQRCAGPEWSGLPNEVLFGNRSHYLPPLPSTTPPPPAPPPRIQKRWEAQACKFDPSSCAIASPRRVTGLPSEPVPIPDPTPKPPYSRADVYPVD